MSLAGNYYNLPQAGETVLTTVLHRKAKGVTHTREMLIDFFLGGAWWLLSPGF